MTGTARGAVIAVLLALSLAFTPPVAVSPDPPAPGPPSGSTVVKVVGPAAPPPALAAPRAPVKPPPPVVKPRAVRPAVAPKRRPPVPRRAVAPRTITISRYVDAPGSQAAIDACSLVLWIHTPLWLAGHNYCGYQWFASIPTGTVVRITAGVAAGRFVVTGRLRLSRQSGALPAVHADLVLQTCVGSYTALTLLRRLRS